MAILSDAGGTSPKTPLSKPQINAQAATYAYQAAATSAKNAPTPANIATAKNAFNAQTAANAVPGSSTLPDYSGIIAGIPNTIANAKATIAEANTAVADYNTLSADLNSTLGNLVNPPKKDPVYDALLAAMGVYKIDNLAATLDKIRMDYPDITSADMLTLLRNDSRYNGEYLNRFAGNKTLAANGKPMLDEKTYLQNEQAYAATFKAYGLNQYFSSPDMYAKLIGGEVAPTEMANRVSAVYDRVLNADPSTLDVYKRYYKGLGTQDIVAAILDPKDTMPAIERKITSAEIGGAAVRQGLNAYQAATDIQSQRYSNVMAGTVGTDALAASGESGAQATADYAKIAYELPTFEKLSAISGSNLQQYGQKQAEQNTILQLASAKRAKDAQIAAEQARFGGSSGTSKGAFSTGYLSKESGAGQF